MKSAQPPLRSSYSREDVKTMFDAIFLGGSFLKAYKLAKPALLQRDQNLLYDFRQVFQQEITKLKDSINSDGPTQEEKIANMLAIYPFLHPTDEDTLEINEVEYQVQPIELTPDKGLFARFLSNQDSDRVFAIGLEAKGKAGNKLIFAG